MDHTFAEQEFETSYSQDSQIEFNQFDNLYSFSVEMEI